MLRSDGSYDNEDEFKRLQDLWYETRDEKYLFELYPIVLHAVKSMMTKQLKNRWIPNFNELADNATLYFLERAKRKGPVKGKIITYAYWLSRYALSGRFTRQNQFEFDIEESTANTSLDEIQSNAVDDGFEDKLVDELTSYKNNKFIKFEEYMGTTDETIMKQDLERRIAFCEEMRDKLFAIKLDDDEQNEVVKYFRDGNQQNIDFFKAMRDSIGAQSAGILLI